MEDHNLSLLVHRSLQSVIDVKEKTQSFKFLNEKSPMASLYMGKGCCLPHSPSQQAREGKKIK